MIKCQFEDAKNADALLRHVVTDVICLKDGKLLLIKRAEHLTNGGLWALPGGFVSRDESVEEASLRELKEESGFAGKITKFLGMFDSPARKGDDLKRQNIAMVYLVEVGNRVQKPDDETTEVQWFELDKLPKEKEFAFDHFKMVQLFLRDRVQY